jgi:hypothetical protein
MTDFLRDPVWQGIAVLLAIVIPILSLVISLIKKSINRTQSKTFSEWRFIQLFRFRNPNLKTSTYFAVWHGAAMKHISGHQIDEICWIATPEQQASFMAYGPYIELPPGRYQVIFSLKTDSTTKKNVQVCRIEATERDGEQSLDERILHTNDFGTARDVYQDFYLNFELTKIAKRVEFRLLHYGTCSVTLKRVALSMPGNSWKLSFRG